LAYFGPHRYDVMASRIRVVNAIRIAPTPLPVVATGLTKTKTALEGHS
jgi:hypothetical protein